MGPKRGKMRESAQKPFKSIANHFRVLIWRSKYEILIEVFVWFGTLTRTRMGKRRKLGVSPDILIEVFVRFVGAHLDDDVSLDVLARNIVIMWRGTKWPKSTINAINPFKPIANTFAWTCSYSTLLRRCVWPSAYVCDTIVILVRVIKVCASTQ